MLVEYRKLLFKHSTSVSLLVLVAAEMVGASSGLGYFVLNAEQRFAIPDMFAGILALTILGLIVNYVFVAFEKRASKWKEEIVHG